MNWLSVTLAAKPITNYRASRVKRSWSGQQTQINNSSIHFNQKKNSKFSFFFQWIQWIFWFVEFGEIKKYYNSNLYEADSYLVIIIECFCEEWTNTWNWLRRELVAEYKGRASHCGMKINFNLFEWSEWAQQAPPQQMNKSMEWRKREIYLSFDSWNWFMNVACCGKSWLIKLIGDWLNCCGLWGWASPMLRNNEDKPNQPINTNNQWNLWMNLKNEWTNGIEGKAGSAVLLRRQQHKWKFTFFVCGGGRRRRTSGSPSGATAARQAKGKEKAIPSIPAELWAWNWLELLFSCGVIVSSSLLVQLNLIDSLIAAQARSGQQSIEFN